MYTLIDIYIYICMTHITSHDLINITPCYRIVVACRSDGSGVRLRRAQDLYYMSLSC